MKNLSIILLIAFFAGYAVGYANAQKKPDAAAIKEKYAQIEHLEKEVFNLRLNSEFERAKKLEEQIEHLQYEKEVLEEGGTTLN